MVQGDAASVGGSCQGFNPTQACDEAQFQCLSRREIPAAYDLRRIWFRLTALVDDQFGEALVLHLQAIVDVADDLFFGRGAKPSAGCRSSVIFIHPIAMPAPSILSGFGRSPRVFSLDRGLDEAPFGAWSNIGEPVLALPIGIRSHGSAKSYFDIDNL